MARHWVPVTPISHRGVTAHRVGTGGCHSPHPHFGVPRAVHPVLEPSPPPGGL